MHIDYVNRHTYNQATATCARCKRPFQRPKLSQRTRCPRCAQREYEDMELTRRVLKSKP